MTSRAVPKPTLRRSRNLTVELVDAIGDRIRDGRLAAGDKLPTEAEIMAAFGVSRTVVREALSKLQAGGQVRTRHGIGTFVVGAGDATPFRISPDQLATLQDVIAMLELRIGVPAMHKWVDRVDGERARPVVITPVASVGIPDGVAIVPGPHCPPRTR